MKRVIAFILILSLCLSLAACGGTGNKTDNYTELTLVAPAPTQTPTEPPIDPFTVDDGLVDSTNDIVIDFYEFLDQKNAEHKAVLDTTYSDKWYKQYTPDFHDTLDLVSKEEAEKLLSSRVRSLEEWCSKDDALKDVELLFRVLKSFYGPYYHFGGEEAFDAAEERILAEIQNKPEKFTIAEFAECIAKKLDFVLDRHFGVGENNNLCDINNITVYDFYVKDLYFYQDDVGYFTKINDRKWYIQQVGTDANFLDYFQITVDGKGQLCYCLLLCEPKTGLHTSIHDITLSRGERSVTLPIAWKMYLQRANLDLKISEKISTKDNIPLLRVRFGSSTSGTDRDDQAQRLRVMGRDFLSQDVFIYDFVSGSGCQALFDSIRHQNVELSLYRFSNLASDLGRWNMPWDIAGRGEYGVRYFKGVWGKNDTLAFTVQDKTDFSAPSLSIANIRAIENSLTIGGSTGGSVGPGGSTNQSMVLYNTGMLVEFGAALQIVAGYTEDGYCIEPDIWYEPREAAEAAYRICEFYGIENTVDTSTLAQYNYGE